MKTLFISVLCLAVLAGCYPHIQWAKDNGVLYSVQPLTNDEWDRRGYPARGMGAYMGKSFGVHQIVIRKGWENSKYIVNHELRHARGWKH